MHRAQLAEILADTVGLTKTQAMRIVDVVFANITEALVRGEDVRLIGFGTFVPSERRATMARHPATGERLAVAAAHTVRFRPGTALKSAINVRS